MTLDNMDMETWYTSLYNLPRIGMEVLTVTLPNTNLSYLMDVADKGFTPLFDDPKQHKTAHEQFRELVAKFGSSTRCVRVYLCESEQK